MASTTTRRSVAVAVVAFVVLALAAFGAGGSLPPLVQLPTSEVEVPDFIPPTMEQTLEPGEAAEAPEELPELPGLPDWVTDVLMAVLVFIAVPVVVWAIVRIVQAQLAIRARRARTPNIRFTEVGDVIDEEQLAESFAEALASLRRGVAVDRAILECWRRMERLVADTGTVRAPTQTPIEFTVEVLANTTADPTALGTLSELYQQAAFSDHRLTDVHRDDAIRALESLHVSLGAGIR